RHLRRWRVNHVTGWHAVDVHDLPARTPLEQRRGDPRLLLELRVARLDRALEPDRIQVPEHALATAPRQVVEVVEGDVDGASAHGAAFRSFGARSSPASQPPTTPTRRPSPVLRITRERLTRQG